MGVIAAQKRQSRHGQMFSSRKTLRALQSGGFNVGGTKASRALRKGVVRDHVAEKGRGPNTAGLVADYARCPSSTRAGDNIGDYAECLGRDACIASRGSSHPAHLSSCTADQITGFCHQMCLKELQLAASSRRCRVHQNRQSELLATGQPPAQANRQPPTSSPGAAAKDARRPTRRDYLEAHSLGCHEESLISGAATKIKHAGT